MGSFKFAQEIVNYDTLKHFTNVLKSIDPIWETPLQKMKQYALQERPEIKSLFMKKSFVIPKLENIFDNYLRVENLRISELLYYFFFAVQDIWKIDAIDRNFMNHICASFELLKLAELVFIKIDENEEKDELHNKIKLMDLVYVLSAEIAFIPKNQRFNCIYSKVVEFSSKYLLAITNIRNPALVKDPLYSLDSLKQYELMAGLTELLSFISGYNPHIVEFNKVYNQYVSAKLFLEQSNIDSSLSEKKLMLMNSLNYQSKLLGDVDRSLNSLINLKFPK